MEIVQVIACFSTVVCAVFAYLAYKNAKEVNMKIDNSKHFNIPGEKNTIQQHEGTGDNIGRDKNE